MNDELRAVATELLRLYDWRFELAKEEEWLRGERPSPNDYDLFRKRQREYHANIRQYGTEKKAAWERLRALLARTEDEPQPARQKAHEELDRTIRKTLERGADSVKDMTRIIDFRFMKSILEAACELGFVPSPDAASTNERVEAEENE